MVLLVFWKMVFNYSRKFNLLSRNIPKCFWRGACGTTFSLKNKEGWLVVCTLREKISSCTCLVGPGLKFIFHLNAHSPIFFKSLFRLIFEVSTFLTTDKLISFKDSLKGLLESNLASRKLWTMHQHKIYQHKKKI